MTTDETSHEFKLTDPATDWIVEWEGAGLFLMHCPTSPSDLYWTKVRGQGFGMSQTDAENAAAFVWHACQADRVRQAAGKKIRVPQPKAVRRAEASLHVFPSTFGAALEAWRAQATIAAHLEATAKRVAAQAFLTASTPTEERPKPPNEATCKAAATVAAGDAKLAAELADIEARALLHLVTHLENRPAIGDERSHP